MITRRQFLKAGLVGGVVLAALGAYYAARQSGARTEPGTLGDNQRTILAAIAPAVLAGMLPAAPGARRAALEKTVDAVATEIAGLSAGAQAEIGQLFALLDVAPARVLVAGVWPSWPEADADEVAAFLQRWRMSRFALLRSAYAAFHDLVLGAWYGEPDAWPQIGYPGPPKLV